MSKYTKILLFNLIGIIVFLGLINVRLLKVSAEDITQLSPTDYGSHLNDTITTSTYYTELDNAIIKYFPSFNMDPSTFEEQVAGQKNYNILEITPASYTGADESVVSNLQADIDNIKSIYSDAILRNNVTAKYFITNMPNFNVDVMTIKQFVDDKATDLGTKYDAVVFDSGDYSNKNILSCAYTPDPTKEIPVKIYDSNHVLRYNGDTVNGGNTLSQIVPNGYGIMYDQYGHKIYAGYWLNGQYNGTGQLFGNNALSYNGSWINGQQSCFGTAYDSSGQLIYQGQWKNGDYDGYGMQWNQNGVFQYQGYFYNGSTVNPMPGRDVLNDISAPAANLIINDYIKKGLPVFFSQDIFNTKNSNLYTYFNPLVSEYSNIYTFADTTDTPLTNDDFYHSLSIMAITELVSKKPGFEVTNKPSDYYSGSAATYQTNDKIGFTVNLTNLDSANLLLYIDVNQDNTFESNELAYATTINKGNNSFTYTLPQVYNGLLNYQIVVEANNLQSSYNGTIRIKNPGVQVINVLDVVSSYVYFRSGGQYDMNDPALFNLYFQNNGDYKINFTECLASDFNTNNSNKTSCSHNVSLNNYDVVFFGQDTFDQNFNMTTYNDIESAINNGMPMVFSAYMTKGNPNWVSYYRDELGLSDYSTQLYKLENNVDSLQIVNQNGFTSFPNNMNAQTLEIPDGLNYAYNEAYQLDLSNPNVTPLINMYNSTDSTYDRYDSYNNFYYYNVNNLVYLNIGNDYYNYYKASESELLANAIVNLYIQRKAKDATLGDVNYITANNTYQNALIDTKDPVNFSFSIFSSTNQNYDYQLYVNDKLISDTTVQNNQLINVSLSDFDTPTDNTINEDYIYVKLTDGEGKIQTYGFNVFVANFSNYNISFSQSITPIYQNKYIEVNKSGKYSLQYALTLRNIDVSYLDVTNLPSSFSVSNMQFSTILPNSITVDNSANNFNLTTDSSGNTILSKSIPTITYTLQGTNYVPSVTLISLSIPITATSAADYSLANSTFTYNGIGGDSDTYTYSPLTFTAIKYLDPSMVNFDFSNYIFINGTWIDDLSKKFTISPDTQVQSIQFNLLSPTDGSPTSHLALDGYKLSTLSVGTQQMEIVVTDIFGNTVRKTFNVVDYVPVSSLDLSQTTMYTGDTTQLGLLVNPASVDLSNIQLTVSPANQNVVSLQRVGNAYYVTGLNAGYVQVTATGYNYNGDLISVSNDIVVNQKYNIHFINPFMTMFIGDTYSYTNLYNNLQIDAAYSGQTITLTSSDPSVLSVDSNNNIIANGAGQAIITASLPNGSSSQLLVKVYDYMSQTESGFNTAILSKNLYAGINYDMTTFVQVIPNTIDLSDVTMDFSLVSPDASDFLYFNDSTHPNQFETLSTYSGPITLQVVLTQYKNGVAVRTVTSQITLMINPVVNPVTDGVDNKH